MSLENKNIDESREALGVLVVVKDKNQVLELLENWDGDLKADQMRQIIKLLDEAKSRLADLLFE